MRGTTTRRHALPVLALALLSGPRGPLLRGVAAQDLSSSSSTSSTSTSIIPTKNYIDTISGYRDLSTCAEFVLSTVVRGEYSGCADTYALTSYTCFCTDSSSFMSAVISSDVLRSCGGGSSSSSLASAQASSAIDVFNSYCALGVPAGLTTQTAAEAYSSASTTTSSSATPAASVAATTVTVSSGPTDSSSSSSNTSSSSGSHSSSSSSSSPSSTTTAIIIGVLVSICGILFVVAAWLLWRRHKAAARTTTSKARPWPTSEEGLNRTATGSGSGAGAPWKRGPAAEVPAYEHPVEMAASERVVEVSAFQSPVELPGYEYHSGETSGSVGSYPVK